jgi:hypothetical protein
MFLTKEELAELSHRKQKGKQTKWLDDNGIPYIPSSSGHPKVPIAVIENLGLSMVNNKVLKKRTLPDINGLKEKLNRHAKTTQN